jgi:hypothetical protein
MAQIHGNIHSIDSKYMKMGDFAWNKRKISPNLTGNELHSEYNRKISAYFYLAGTNKDKTSY